MRKKEKEGLTEAFGKKGKETKHQWERVSIKIR